MRVTRPVIYLLLLLALVAASTVVASLPTVSALSCPSDPSYWVPEGQYTLPGGGLLTDGRRMWLEDQPISIFKAKPGANASVVVSYKRLDTDSSPLNLTVSPIFGIGGQIGGALQERLPAPYWLKTTSNSTVSLRSGVEHVNVTVNFAISRDAPLGEYLLHLAVEKTNAASPQEAICSSGYSEFYLRIAMDKKDAVTVTTTTTAVTTLTSTSTTVFSTTLTSITTVTSTEQVTEPLYLAWALGATTLVIIATVFIILVKYESGKLKRSVK